MTLTLEIPKNTEVGKLKKVAIALYDAGLVTQGQAAEMTGLSRRDFIEALIRAEVSVIQYDGADEILAEADLLAARP